jgi:hypothetical protein
MHEEEAVASLEMKTPVPTGERDAPLEAQHVQQRKHLMVAAKIAAKTTCRRVAFGPISDKLDLRK